MTLRASVFLRRIMCGVLVCTLWLFDTSCNNTYEHQDDHLFWFVGSHEHSMQETGVFVTSADLKRIVGTTTNVFQQIGTPSTILKRPHGGKVYIYHYRRIDETRYAWFLVFDTYADKDWTQRVQIEVDRSGKVISCTVD